MRFGELLESGLGSQVTYVEAFELIQLLVASERYFW
jgi:hypothetical protein